jgi:WD40 repeat protein
MKMDQIRTIVSRAALILAAARIPVLGIILLMGPSASIAEGQALKSGPDSNLPEYKPEKPPSKVGTPGTAHRVYKYDRTHERLFFGGADYVVNEKGGPISDPDMSTLYELNLATGATQKVFAIPGRTLAAYSISPDGRYIAIRSWINENLATMTLHIIDPAGQELSRIGQVWDYAWSPDGNQLVYVTGEYRAGKDGVTSTGVWKYDVRLKASVKIHETGRFVFWAGFDRSIYVLEYLKNTENHKVWRLNPSDLKPQATGMYSIYLSPTGRYYYHPGASFTNEGSFDVYDIATNTPRFSTSTLAQKFAWGTEPIGWMDTGGNHLLLVTWSNPVTGQLDSHPHTMMYDLDAGTMVSLELEGVIGWKNGAFLTHREGQFRQEQSSSRKQ